MAFRTVFGVSAACVAAASVALRAHKAKAAVVAPSPPVFPNNWYAYEKAYQFDANGNIVNTATVNSCWQQDNFHNRTAYQALDGGEGQMFDWDQNTVYVMQDNVCQFTCDISDLEQCDGEDSLCDYDYTHSATYNGTAVIDGQNTTSFTWAEALGPIVMNTLTLYTVPNKAIPVQMYRLITPFGTLEGAFQNNYVNFTAGTPPESCFSVPGAQYCQQGDDDGCNSYSAKAAKIRAMGGRVTTGPFHHFSSRRVQH